MQTKKSALSFCIFSLPCFIAYVLSAAPHLPHARPQQDANALHRLAAHCHARRFTQSSLRALQPPMSETTPGTEPPYPVSPHISDVSAQRKIRGSQEGDKKPYWCLIPLLSPPPDDGKPLYRRKVYPQQRVKKKKKRELIPTFPRPPDSTRPSHVCRSARPAFSSACRPRAAFPSCPRRRRGMRATHSRGSSRR